MVFLKEIYSKDIMLFKHWLCLYILKSNAIYKTRELRIFSILFFMLFEKNYQMMQYKITF